ncbi:hypothetical protein GGR57DRAFT_518544 [Xylariaceae sp. FL1272]|nr:hypothetical protein GGR57DRAFT_518544 [Xylariaceae sp. FL1272]
MSERKVVSKYFPPDFDPSEFRRQRTPKYATKLPMVGFDVPLSMICDACGECIHKARRFNARKEVTDEKYLSIQIFRFYIRCTGCSAEVTFKTDPKNSGYTREKGAKRLTEPWRRSAMEESDDARLHRLKLEALEAKAIDAKREPAVADALNDIRIHNARREHFIHQSPYTAEREDEGAIRAQRQDAEVARRAFTPAKLEWEIAEDKIVADDSCSPPSLPRTNITKGKPTNREIRRKHSRKTLVDSDTMGNTLLLKKRITKPIVDSWSHYAKVL